MPLVAAGAALARQATLNSAPAGDRATRELPCPWVHVEVLGPVIAGGVKRIVHALPRGALGFLQQNAHMPALVGDLRSSAELLGDGVKQLLGAPSRARHVDDDRGQRHQSRS
jgi:hypothetical protein